MKRKNKLRMCSYNIAGFNRCNWTYVQQLVDNNDIVLLQELWLHSSEGHRITECLRGVSMHFVSGMADDNLHSGRPFGGCCILWKTKLKCRVSPLSCDNRRICAVKVDLNDAPLLIINLYMPCDTQIAHHVFQMQYDEVLADTASLMQTCNVDRIVLGGDLNTDLRRQLSAHTRALLRFVNDEDLSLLNTLACYDVDYTHESDAHRTRSTLDHFIVSDQLLACVQSVHCDHSALSSSDHSALLMSLSIGVSSLPQQPGSRRGPIPLWRKATDTQVANYKAVLDELVAALETPYHALRCDSPHCTDHAVAITSYYKSLVNACLSLANVASRIRPQAR